MNSESVVETEAEKKTLKSKSLWHKELQLLIEQTAGAQLATLPAASPSACGWTP